MLCFRKTHAAGAWNVVHTSCLHTASFESNAACKAAFAHGKLSDVKFKAIRLDAGAVPARKFKGGRGAI